MQSRGLGTIRVIFLSLQGTTLPAQELDGGTAGWKDLGHPVDLQQLPLGKAHWSTLSLCVLIRKLEVLAKSAS